MRSPSGEAPHEPGVDRAAEELAAFGPRLRPGHLVEDPADLRRREVRVDHEAGALADKRVQAAGAELFADRGTGAALPDDRAMDRCPRRSLPHDRRLALVRDADGGEVARADARRRE